MPLFSKKQPSSRKLSSSSSSMKNGSSRKLSTTTRKLAVPTKKEKILELNLIATGFKFGKGGGPGGWYRPFVQLTNVNGQVVGRSQVISCAHEAQWPTMRLAWKPFAPPKNTAVAGSALTVGSASTRSVQSESSSVDEAALTQPLLLVVYEYKDDGMHSILGRVKVSLQSLIDSSRELKASPKDTAKESPCGKYTGVADAVFHMCKCSSAM